MKPVIIVDTNIILRLILADEPKLSLQARAIFDRAETGQVEIYIDEIAIAEIVWVLSSFYRQPKQDIVRHLKDMISQTWIVNPRKKLVLAALDLFSETNLSYIDAWILSVSKQRKIELKTFDKKLGKK
jgi:predicted nucleic acid-binding protein